MRKLNYVNLLAAQFAFIGLMGTDALGAELEGALQYPPVSIGADAQPPPPARMVPQIVSPRRIELGVSGSSFPPTTQRSLTSPHLQWDRPGATPETGSGGG